MASVGGSAASGLEAGFSMGLRADEANERRKQREFENTRQTTADAERTAQTARSNARQDKQDAYAEDDRALTGLDKEMQDHALYGAGLAQQYGGAQKIPGDVGSQYATKAQDIGNRRAAVLRRRYEPEVQKEQQWAKDTASRIQTGQMSMDDLSPADTVRLIQANTRRPVSDFIRGDNGTSRVKQGIDDTTAGIETNNQGLMIQGANGLLGPELQTGLGHVTRDGSQIVGKSLYALVPAPGAAQPQQPQGNPIQNLTSALTAATMPDEGGPGEGQQPTQESQQSAPVPGQPVQQPQQSQPAGSGTLMPSNQPGRVLPVLQVTARHPDGTEVTYHAPVTKGRGVGPDDEVHPGLDIGDAMEHMGKLGTLEAWMNTPEARAKIDQGVKELGGNVNSFLGSYYAMHGDAKALLPAGSEDPTTKKISAIQKFAKDQGLTFEQAARQLDGKSGAGVAGTTGPLARKFADIDNSNLSGEDKAAAKRVAALGVKMAGDVEAAPATPATSSGLPTKVSPSDQAARDSDATKIMQREKGAIEQKLAAAKTPEDKARAQSELDGINKEIAGQGGTIAAPGSKTAAAAPTSSPALGDTTAPDPKADHMAAVKFWAKAVIAGDRDWQVGLSRGKDGAKLISDVKAYVPKLAAEMGLDPQDMGTTRAQSAALSSTLKDLTKRAEAVELFSNKVSKDMATFDSLLDNASTGSPLLISKPINTLRRQFSDPDLAQLDLAAKQVGAEYERLITGGTLSVAQLHAGASEDAKALINGDMPPAEARAKMQIMRQEMANAKAAAHESQARVTDQMRALGRGRGSGLPSATSSTAKPPPGVPTAVNPKTGERLVLQNGQWVPLK